MPLFPNNPRRLDPYKNFKFRVKMGNDYVLGVSKMSALKRTTEVIKHRDGGSSNAQSRSPGRTEYEPITLERGVTQDPAFEDWANKVWKLHNGPGSEQSLADFRKDLYIEVYNEAGQLVLGYTVYRAWVSEYQALPEQDANANAIAIQTLKLEHEGWKRDVKVLEPAEPVLT